MNTDNNNYHLNILIIEDSPIIMEVHKALVKQLGYEADYAEDGAQALKLCRKNKYDLILSDIGLPEIDGIQLAERLRIHESMANTKKAYIVAITAFVLEDIREQCFISGIDEVIAKPIAQDVMKSIMVNALVKLQSPVL